MRALQSKIIKYFILFLFVPSAGFAEIKHFVADGTFSMDNFEVPAIIEERAAFQARISMMPQVQSYLEHYLEGQNIKLTSNQIQALASVATNYEILDTKKIVAEGQVKYSVRIKASVSPEGAKKWSSQVSGKLVGEDYRDLFKDMEKNQKEVSSLKKRLINTIVQKEVEEIKTAIQNKNRSFESFILFHRGLDQFVRSEYESAIESLSKSIDVNGSYIAAYSYRGAIYDKTGQENAAVKDYSEIIKLDPKRAIAYHNLGSLYVKRGRNNDAIQELTKAIALNPRFIESYGNRGFAYHQKGDYDKAIEDFSKAISIDPTAYEAYYNRGYTYYKKDQYERAIKDFTRAIELYPEYQEAYSARGLAYNALGKNENGLSDIKKACSLNYEEACKLLGRKSPEELEYDKAWLYLNSQENEKALSTVKQINKPDDMRSVVLMGLISLRMNDPQQALNIVDRSLPEAERIFNQFQNQGGDSDREKYGVFKKFYYYLFFIRGLAFFQMDDCNGAIRDFSKYLQDDNDNLDANEKISICYYREKKYSESLPYFKRIYEILKEGPEKDSAAYSISSLYALLGNVDQAIYWLNIPLKHKYRTQVLEKVKLDKDFNGIRQDKGFEKFLKKQEAIE